MGQWAGVSGTGNSELLGQFYASLPQSSITFMVVLFYLQPGNRLCGSFLGHPPIDVVWVPNQGVTDTVVNCSRPTLCVFCCADCAELYCTSCVPPAGSLSVTRASVWLVRQYDGTPSKFPKATAIVSEYSSTVLALVFYATQRLFLFDDHSMAPVLDGRCTVEGCMVCSRTAVASHGWAGLAICCRCFRGPCRGVQPPDLLKAVVAHPPRFTHMLPHVAHAVKYL